MNGELVAPGVVRFAARTPTLPPATHTNSYALDGGREVVVVEPATPYADERAAFVEWVRGFERDGRRVLALLATHHHADHVGGAAHFAQELGLPLWAHERTAQLLPELTFARHLHDGEVLDLGQRRWSVLHTPGHAPGHICLHDAQDDTIVAGDMVASIGTILIPPDDGDMGEYLRQLERLRALAARVALPAHGDPIQAPAALFSHYVTHRLAREAKVLAALATPGTLDDLLPRVYDDVAPLALPFARMSLLAHLDKLVREQRVQVHDGHYGVAP